MFTFKTYIQSFLSDLFFFSAFFISNLCFLIFFIRFCVSCYRGFSDSFREEDKFFVDSIHTSIFCHISSYFPVSKLKFVHQVNEVTNYWFHFSTNTDGTLLDKKWMILHVFDTDFLDPLALKHNFVAP